MAFNGNTKEPLRWAVYDDGLRIYYKAALIVVIENDELHHLSAEILNLLRWKHGKGAKKKPCRSRAKLTQGKVSLFFRLFRLFFG